MVESDAATGIHGIEDDSTHRYLAGAALQDDATLVVLAPSGIAGTTN